MSLSVAQPRSQAQSQPLAQPLPQPQRLTALDAQRGLIMIFMALDHASLFIAGQHFAEYWGIPLPDYGDAFSLFTRVISHLCAPGFFFLMGVGMHLYWSSRRARGVEERTIIRHFAVRGTILIAVDIFIITPTWIIGTLEDFLAGKGPIDVVPGAGESIMMVTGVLAALGAAMLLTGFVLRLSGTLTAVLGIAILLICQLGVPEAARVFEPMTQFERIFLVAGHDGILLVNYPILPWLSVCLLGVAFGHLARADAERAMKLALPAGVVALVLFVLVRGAGGFGTHHPAPGDDWMALLTVTKYPPSLAFLLLSLGANALFLSLIHSLENTQGKFLEGVGRPLLVFGRAPLFFYVAHLYLYSIVGLLIPGATSLAAMYPVWLIGLVVLYPACKRYDGFKRGKAEDSIWRLF